jgi:hypothetical protein
MKNNIFTKNEELIFHITNLLKSKNYEPLPSNHLIKYNIIFGEILPSFQKFLIFENNKSAKDLLISTDKALITQLRLYDALFTGKISHNNYERAVLFRVFSKDTGAKRDLKLSFNYIKNENSIKNSEEFILIKKNLTVLKENILIVENFLKKTNQIPNSLSIESPIYIDNIDFFLDESLNKNLTTELTEFEINVMESYLLDFSDNVF